MAIKPMPTPSADPYSAYNTEKNKKKKQTNSPYVTNTVTPPSKPAQEVPQAQSVTSNYTQPVQNQTQHHRQTAICQIQQHIIR